MSSRIVLLNNFVIFLFLAGCGFGGDNVSLTEKQKTMIAERIAPVGSIVKVEDLVQEKSDVSSAMMPDKVALSQGNEHVVEMLNSGDGGNMIFDPPVIKVSKGDTIHFRAVDMSHNSATINSMIPSGAESWTGLINQDISVVLDIEGVYVYQCDPHAMMAMVGVIQVGAATNISEVKIAAEEYKSNFMLNTDRLTGYLAQL
tara:strand:+ start:11978 stop:12580 length:603 start_codon:yes stop_codon:yes gene_type:complete